MHDGGDGSMRHLTGSRDSKSNKAVMLEPNAKIDSMASENKAAVSMINGKNPVKTHGSHQPYLLHPPTHHIGVYHHLGPGHHTERIVAVDAELQCAHEELAKLKEQLTVSEAGKAQALAEFTSIKNLLDHISLVEHFAASDNVEVETAPLPLNWRDGSSGQIDSATHKEIDRLRNELAASRNLNLKFAAELDNAKQEIDRVHCERTSLELEDSRMETSKLQPELASGRGQQGSICLELENAKKDISTLQATLRDAWSHHGACALDLARAKEEIAWLEADLEAAQNLTVELAHAKNDMNILQEDLESARRMQNTSSVELSEMRKENSRLRSLHEASSSELATAISSNSALRADLENLRVLYETSSSELQNAKKDILKLLADYEISIFECVDAKEEIRRLQCELTATLTNCRDSATELRSKENEMDKLQTKLQVVTGKYDSTCTELSEARGQVEELRAELEALRVKYEISSSALFNAKIDVLRLETEKLANHENLSAGVIIAEEENLNLQTEIAALKAEKTSLIAELGKAREEVNYVQVELRAACNELFSAGRDIARLQDELSALAGQHGVCCRELATLKNNSMHFQFELTQVQELHSIVLAMLVSARDEIKKLHLVSTKEFESASEVVRGLKEEIGEVQADFSMQCTIWILEKSLIEKEMEELTLELMATNAHLEKTSAALMQAETELAATFKETVDASTVRADLEAVRVELLVAREAESKLRERILEVEELRSQMTVSKESMATLVGSESIAEMDALRAELDALKASEANYREIVNSSQAEIEALKTYVYALRDSEAKAKESSVATGAELHRAKVELVIAKEALEWVGGDAAALSAELEALKAEVTTTKEGESRAKAAFMDYSLKLQRMRLDLEDASKLADKVPIKAQPIKAQARTFKLDLDETTAKLQKVTESEMKMSASMASLRAELNNAMAELAATREDNGKALGEKELQYEVELDHMRAQLEAAVISETTLRDANFALNESLIKVMAEAEEATFAVGQATEEAEKARQEAEEAQAHIETIDAKLQALQLEVEAVKASEEWAFTQMRLKAIPEYYGLETGEEQEGGISLSLEEYQSLTTKTKDLQELVNKRAAVGIAQVNAAKASEKEMRRKVEILQKEVQACRTELNEAVSKREEAEAAKFSCEAALRAKRMEGKSLSFSGALHGGHPTGKLVDARQGSMNNSSYLEDSHSSSSPSRSSFSVARGERSPVESLAVRGFSTRIFQTASEEKQKKLKFSSKIGAYFSKRRDYSTIK